MEVSGITFEYCTEQQKWFMLLDGRRLMKNKLLSKLMITASKWLKSQNKQETK